MNLPEDIDCPESQEVLVSKEVCLQFGIGCLFGAAIAPFRLWLSSPAYLRQGMGWLQLAGSAQSFGLWACLAVVRAFSRDPRIAIPQSGLLSQASSLRLPSGHSGPLLPVPPLLASGGCEHLGCCTSGNCCWPHNLWVLIIYLSFLPVILPSEIPRLTTDLPESVSWFLETSLF